MNLEEILKQSVGEKIVHSVSESDSSCWLFAFENKTWFYLRSTWRIELNKKVVITSVFLDYPKMIKNVLGVRQLEGCRLLSFNVSNRYDLHLFFDNGYVIRCFCVIPFSDEQDVYDDEINWAYFIPSKNVLYQINNRFQVEKMKYKEVVF